MAERPKPLRRLRRDLAALPFLALLAAAVTFLSSSSSRAAGPIELGVIVASGGSTATSEPGGCSTVQVGDMVAVDIAVGNVEDLRAWELTFGFDPAVLEVLDHDNRVFLPFASFDISDPVPDIDGQHYLAVASLGSGSSGSGALARLTLRAKAPGRSPASIVFLDVNGDGTIDIGPRLNPGARPLGDTNGDGVFDGPTYQAEIAVGQPCSGPGPQPASTPSASGSPAPDDTPGDTAAGNSGSSSGSRHQGEIDSPPALVLLSDSPPRFAARGAGRSSQTGEDIIYTGQGDNPSGGRAATGAADDPPAGDSGDGRGSDGAFAPRSSAGGSSGLPLWLIVSLAGLSFGTLAGGALIVRSLRNPW